MRFPDKNTTTRNSIEVFLKALFGFLVGGIAVIWAVPGVPEAITSYVRDHWMDVFLTVVVPGSLGTGLVNFFFDWRKKDMENY